MIFKMRGLRRFVAGLAGAALGLAMLVTPSRAQNPNEADFQQAPAPSQDSETDPLYGYMAFGVIAGLAVFIVCKSARRG
jgi:hypothetical protein